LPNISLTFCDSDTFTMTAHTMYTDSTVNETQQQNIIIIQKS